MALATVVAAMRLWRRRPVKELVTKSALVSFTGADLVVLEGSKVVTAGSFVLVIGGRP